jgi:hypothetical protein
VISVGALTPILVCFHKLEITPPSNFNHSRDGTDAKEEGEKSDADTNPDCRHRDIPRRDANRTAATGI